MPRPARTSRKRSLTNFHPSLDLQMGGSCEYVNDVRRCRVKDNLTPWIANTSPLCVFGGGMPLGEYIKAIG